MSAFSIARLTSSFAAGFWSRLSSNATPFAQNRGTSGPPRGTIFSLRSACSACRDSWSRTHLHTRMPSTVRFPGQMCTSVAASTSVSLAITRTPFTCSLTALSEAELCFCFDRGVERGWKRAEKVSRDSHDVEIN
eukprot:2169563-Rhodomonas_salina.3